MMAVDLIVMMCSHTAQLRWLSALQASLAKRVPEFFLTGSRGSRSIREDSPEGLNDTHASNSSCILYILWLRFGVELFRSVAKVYVLISFSKAQSARLKPAARGNSAVLLTA